MSKDKIVTLFVGESPLGTSGNAGMMASLINQLDTEKHQAMCFAADTKGSMDPLMVATHQSKISLISAAEPKNPWGPNRLINIIQRLDFDILMFVGIDIWIYLECFPHIEKIRKEKGFRWGAIFPWDIWEIRKDWIAWINMLDYPCVYSKYGYDVLKEHVPRIRYFRPQLHDHERWRSYKPEIKKEVRRNIFSHLSDDTIIFGYVGGNQHRKDPQGTIKAYSMVKKDIPKTSLYLHTALQHGIFNLKQYAEDCGLNPGDIAAKPENMFYKLTEMPNVYNAIDCLVVCSMQEGLSWVPLEAMLCGCPVIASNTTAHPELVGGVGELVDCTIPSMIPMKGKSGMTWIDSWKCDPKDIAEKMTKVAMLPEKRDQMRTRGLERGKHWLKGVSDINELLTEASCKPAAIKMARQNRVLFMQHSSAGDVFMTTRCFKGLKERHNSPIDYMTSSQYMSIIEDNPYIDKVIAWDEGLKNSARDHYAAVYNPHGEKILPGSWGRNCNTILSDFYWKILRVEPHDFFIKQIEPQHPDVKFMLKQLNDNPREILVVHTTGGDAQFRTYKYMKDICNAFRDECLTVQLGGGQDFPGWADIDLRGKLNFKETAWVMAKAKICVNVDSFISHLAGSFGISQVCLFGSGNYMVVRPNQTKGKLICLTPSYIEDGCIGLGPCSASIRECPAPCTGKHSPASVIRAVEDLWQHPSEINVPGEIEMRISE